MQAHLYGSSSPAAHGVRPFSDGDRQALGSLLFEAYLGTIDQEEETLDRRRPRSTRPSMASTACSCRSRPWWLNALAICTRPLFSRAFMAARSSPSPSRARTARTRGLLVLVSAPRWLNSSSPASVSCISLLLLRTLLRFISTKPWGSRSSVTPDPLPRSDVPRAASRPSGPAAHVESRCDLSLWAARYARRVMW